MLRRYLARGVAVAALGLLAVSAADVSWSKDRGCVASPAGSKQGFDPVSAVARQMPAVVSVVSFGQDLDRQFDEGVQGRLHPLPGGDRASASGFIVGADGYILTNAHAVTGSGDLFVVDGEQQRFRAAVIGIDHRTDVAVLKIAASTRLPVAPIGASAQLCPGEWVAALGAPFGFEQSVSAGVVSAFPRYLPGRSLMPLIQTDVSLNPGSSGGPLFNSRGEVVGMNSMAYTSVGGSAGVSFALPIETALRIADELRSTGRVRRGQIGVGTQLLTPELASAFGLDGTEGALIVRVDPNGPAAAAGLRSGDIVLSLEGKPAMSYIEIQERVSAARAGSSLLLNVWRHKAPIAVNVSVSETTPDALPREAPAPMTPEVRLGLGLVERPASQGILPQDPGLYVKSVSGSSLRAGLRLGDRILAVNDIRVDRIVELDEALQAPEVGETVALLVRRGTITTFVPVSSPRAKTVSPH